MNNFSQNNEQEIILKWFAENPPKHRKFLDIGGFDGITFSNTRALSLNGWSGVIVEPSPTNFIELMDNYKDFDVKLILGAVSSSGGISRFYIETTSQRGWSSSMHESLVQSKSIMAPHKSITYVQVVSIAQLLAFSGAVDFISIDAEHEDFEILRSIPTNYKLPSLLCIEPSGLIQRQEMKQWALDNRGLKVLHETPENILFFS